MTRPDPYAEIDDVIGRWVEASGSTLFVEWAGEPARYFHIPGVWDFDCFQISVSAPSESGVAVVARSIDTNDGQQMESELSGPAADLDSLMAQTIALVDQWKHRPLTRSPVFMPKQ